jgi:hypothetical protein
MRKEEFKMSVKTLKAYNLKKLVEENVKHNERILTTFLQHEMIVAEGEDGQVAMFCSEGVGEILSVEDKFDLEVCNAPELDENGHPKTISIMPLGTIGITPKEVMERCESREVFVADFIRKFGSRLEDNFDIQLRSLGAIGLNVSEYYDWSRHEERSGRRYSQKEG